MHALNESRLPIVATTFSALSILGQPIPAIGTKAPPFAECLLRFARAPSERASSECFFETAKGRASWKKAAEHMVKLRKDHPDQYWLTLNLARVESRLSSERVERLLRAAADGFAGRQNIAGELSARVPLSCLLIRKGRTQDAAREAERVGQIAALTDDPELRVRAWISYGSHLASHLNDLPRALRVLKRAEAAKLDGQSYHTRFRLLNLLGSIHHRFGHFSRAKAYLRRSAALATRENDALGAASVRAELGDVLLDELERLPHDAPRQEALRLVSSHLEEVIRRGLHTLEPHARWQAAALQGESPVSMPAARDHLERCLAATKDAPPTTDRAECGARLALFVAARAPERARSLMDEAISTARTEKDLRRRASLSRARSTLAWFLDSPSAALETSQAELATLEGVRALQPPGSGPVSALPAWTSSHYLLSGRMLTSDRSAPPDRRLALAFEVVERMRARALLEAIDRTRARPPERDHRLRAPTHPGTLAEVQDALQDNEAMLLYQIGLQTDLYGKFGGGAWVWAVTRGEVHVLPVPDRLELEDTIPAFLGLFQWRDRSTSQAAQRLHRALVTGPLEVLPPTVDKLIIVPDGRLHQLPFAALQSADGVPLAVTHTLSSVPSATFWLELRRAPPPPETGRPVLAFVDPESSGSLEAHLRTSFDAPSLQLRRRPSARAEGRTAVDRLGGESRLRAGPDATEDALKRDIKDGYRLLHLAAHVVIDHVSPERSAVVLGAEGEDGLLRAHEIAELDLGGTVVVLAPSRNASGVLPGEAGLLSLSRAFWAAGAGAVVGSRWPIRDDDARQIFEVFYDALSGGEPVGAALQQTQRRAIRNGLPPAVWASLVILGDVAAVPFEGGSPHPWRRFSIRVLIGLAIFLVLCGIYAHYRRGGTPSNATPAADPFSVAPPRAP